MKLTILATLLLPSTALAGTGRWRRQDTTICRPGVAGDCPGEQTCRFVTRNPDGSGYDGACAATSQSSSASSSSAVPSPSYVTCRDERDCASGQRCQFATRNPDGSGYDGYCTASTASSSASSSPPSPSGGGGCRVDTDCISTQFCDTNTGGAPVCTNYRDCRYMGCPGGQCVSEQPNVFDPRDPDNSFVCQFASASSSASQASTSSVSSMASSASASGMSASAPNPASATSSAHSSTPTIKLCRNERDCASTQWCQFQTRNPDGSGYNGACVDLTDCRGTLGCSRAGDVCVPPPIKEFFAYRDPSIVFTCQRSDCRTSPCEQGSFCSLYRDEGENYFSYLCFNSTSFPAANDCRVDGCPGGQCVYDGPGFTGKGFECFFDNSTSSSSSSSSSPPTSPIASPTSKPLPNGPGSASAAPTGQPESSHSISAAPQPKQSSAAAHPTQPSAAVPGGESKPALATQPQSSPSSAAAAPMSQSSSSGPDAAPASAPKTSAEPSDCSGQYATLLKLLKEIKYEIKCIQEDVKSLKGEL